MVDVREGGEDAAFWEALGGKDEYVCTIDWLGFLFLIFLGYDSQVSQYVSW